MSEPTEFARYMTREEASSIALAAAKEASRQTLNETFGMLGVNLSDFESMQRFRDDLEWARRARKVSEMTGKRAWTTIISLVSGAVAVGLVEWVRAVFMHKP